MKNWICGLVQRIGTADSATPHPDPSGGQAPALHILIPPSATGVRLGRIRRWRAGIEVDWRAHPWDSGPSLSNDESLGLEMTPAQWYEKPELWLGTANRHGGFCQETPAGDMPPRYIFSFRPRPPESAAGAVYPGSESRTCFHSNCSCRLGPAHHGMKSRSCGLVQRIGTADSATPHPDPSVGQAPALHSLIPPSATGVQVGTFRPLRAGIEVDWRAHPGWDSGTCFHSNRSWRQPAHHGVKSRSCGLVQRIGTADSARPHPDPSGGHAPALHILIPPSATGLQVGTFRRGEPASKLIGGHIPDRSPGHAFVAIAHAGWVRHTKV